MVEHVKGHLCVSERGACRAMAQSRATQRYAPIEQDDEAPLTRRIIELAAMYGRYGYRRITALLNHEGWRVNHKRVERIWRHEGLRVSKKQPKRGRLWLNGGSCVRLRPERKDHVWAYEKLHKVDASERPDLTTRELEAEAVAFVVNSAVGLRTSTASADYIRLYKGDKDKLLASLERIRTTANVIIDALELRRSLESSTHTASFATEQRQR